jgi:AraC family transcriptional regulator, positive regulator of tynA and feaB
MYSSYPLLARSPRERFECFTGLVDEMFCPMELDSSRLERERFSARIDAASLRSVRVVRVSSSPISVRRRPQDIARISDPPYLVKFQLKGESVWSQRGREVHARPGDFVICSTAEPYSLVFRGEYEMPVLVVPESIMRRLTPDPEQFLGLRMPGEDADCGLLSSFVAQVVARMHRLPEPMIQRIEANVLDLLGAVLSARSHPGTLSREQLLSQVKVYVQDHLQDPHLGPASLAQAFAVSTRLIHSLFEGEPMTVCKYIRSLRVQMCRRALEKADATRISLTDLALQWGFYDLSHMSRNFREVYGEPPSSFLVNKRKV